jgi:hypothetical protein
MLCLLRGPRPFLPHLPAPPPHHHHHHPSPYFPQPQVFCTACLAQVPLQFCVPFLPHAPCVCAQFKWTPLSLAIECKRTVMAKKLLTMRADPNCRAVVSALGLGA